MHLRSARRPLLLSLAFGSILGLLSGSGSGCDPSQPSDPSSQLWQHQLGTTADDTLYSVAASASTVYAVGTTSGRLPDYVGLTQSNDGLIVKLSPNGQIDWQKQYGTAAYDEWRGVAVDAAGYAYVVGYTSGAYDGQTKLGGDTDAVLARVRPDGSLDWLRQFGTLAADYGLAVTLDSSGNAYATGWTAGTFPGQMLSGASDGFVVKYRADGTQEWLTQFGSPKEDSLTGIAMDGSGALYVTGWAADSASGQPALGGHDAVIYKVQPGTGVVWARQFGTAVDDETAAIGVSSSAVYVVGRTFGMLAGQAAGGRLDGLVASYDLAGNQRWLRQIGTAGDDELRGLAVDPDGSGVFVGGYVGRALPSTQWRGMQDAIYSKLRSDGQQEWISQFGTTANDAVYGLYSPAVGTLYTAGSTGEALSGQVRFGMTDSFVSRQSVP